MHIFGPYPPGASSLHYIMAGHGKQEMCLEHDSVGAVGAVGGKLGYGPKGFFVGH